MAKVQIKSEKLTPFGGIFGVMEEFVSIHVLAWLQIKRSYHYPWAYKSVIRQETFG